MGKSRRKKRKAVRVFPRKYGAGYVSVGSQLDNDNESNPFTFGNRNKAAQGMIYHVETRTKYYDPIPVTKGLTVARAVGTNSVPRAVVLAQLFQNDRFQNPEEWHPIVVADGKHFKITMWFCGNRFVFVRESKRVPLTVQRSFIYTGRDRAYKALERDELIWSNPVHL